MPRTAKNVRAVTRRVRPVAAFGELLQALRGGRSAEQIVNALRLRPPTINTTQGTVSGYEQGYNRKPDPVVLWGLAKVYGVSLDGLIAVLHANRATPRLSLAEARRILAENVHGPSPEVAAAAIEAAEKTVFAAAGELEAIREGLQTTEKPRR